MERYLLENVGMSEMYSLDLPVGARESPLHIFKPADKKIHIVLTECLFIWVSSQSQINSLEPRQ